MDGRERLKRSLTPLEIVHRERCDELTKNAVEAAKVVKSCVPASDQYEYYAAFPKYTSVIQKLNASVNNTMNSICASEKLSTTFSQTTAVDFTDKFDLLVEANDQILEKVGKLLDEASGLRTVQPAIKVRTSAPAVISSWNKQQELSKHSGKSFSCLNWLPKPQHEFNEKPDNSTLPFTVRLKDKPNNVKKLSRSYSSFVKGDFDQELEDVAKQPLLKRAFSFSKQMVEELTEHHYEAELNSFQPNAALLEPVACQPPSELTNDSLHFIDSLPALEALIKTLSEQSEIAVDCEAHSHRSYLGFVCLLQISTRQNDYIIDTIVLRDHIQKLNAVFTNRDILKVMHGCDSDVLWFQRDFGLYLVNVFDTGQAARALNYPTFALSYLLKRFVNFDAKKEYQMADWRQRPLPAEMLEYARMDTHALLYIADNLRNALYESNLLFEVFNRSRLLCLKKYNKPEYHENSYQRILRNTRKQLTSQQEYIIAKLFDWREETARLLDESPHYVLPNHMLIRIGEVMPREAQGILACCNPVPPLVREYLNVLHKIVLEAKMKMLPTANDNACIPKYQSAPKTSNLSEKSFRHDENCDSSLYSQVGDSVSDELCASEPQVSVIASAIGSRCSGEKFSGVLASLEHPLAKYMADMRIEPTFMTSAERTANALALNTKQKDKGKIPHRWRLSTYTPPVQPIKPIVQSAEKKQKKNEAEIPIVFEESASDRINMLKDKKEIHKEKKRKKRETITENSVPTKKKKGKGEDIELVSRVSENHQYPGPSSDIEELEHPSLVPAKKSTKTKKSSVPHSLMPRIKAFRNKSYSFKISK